MHFLEPYFHVALYRSTLEYYCQKEELLNHRSQGVIAARPRVIVAVLLLQSIATLLPWSATIFAEKEVAAIFLHFAGALLRSLSTWSTTVTLLLSEPGRCHKKVPSELANRTPLVTPYLSRGATSRREVVVPREEEPHFTNPWN